MILICTSIIALSVYCSSIVIEREIFIWGLFETIRLIFSNDQLVLLGVKHRDIEDQVLR